MQQKTRKPDKWALFIQKILEENGLTQADFAKLCGVSRACVCLWVNSNRRPKIESLRSIIAGVARATQTTRPIATKKVCSAYLFDYGVIHVD